MGPGEEEQVPQLRQETLVIPLKQIEGEKVSAEGTEAEVEPGESREGRRQPERLGDPALCRVVLWRRVGVVCRNEGALSQRERGEACRAGSMSAENSQYTPRANEDSPGPMAISSSLTRSIWVKVSTCKC